VSDSKSPEHSIVAIQPVGRYALGVTWADKHESIFPFTNLRQACPCADCRQPSEPARRNLPESAQRLEGVRRLRDASLVLHWADGHDTLYLVEELRGLCGCAACKGEPNYPVTGQ
jgi:DUF971 family protein